MLKAQSDEYRSPVQKSITTQRELSSKKMSLRAHLPAEVLLDSVHVVRQSGQRNGVVLPFSAILSNRQLREEMMCFYLEDSYFMADSQRSELLEWRREKSFRCHVCLCEALVMEEIGHTDERQGRRYVKSRGWLD